MRKRLVQKHERVRWEKFASSVALAIPRGLGLSDAAQRPLPSVRHLGPVGYRLDRLQIMPRHAQVTRHSPGNVADRRDRLPAHGTFRGECIGDALVPRLASMNARPKSRSAWYWLWAAQRSSTLSASWRPPLANGLL